MISKLVVGAVTEGPVRGLLAAADPELCIGRRLKENRLEAGAGMGTIAKGLCGAASAGAPEILPTGLDRHAIRARLRTDRLCHERLPLRQGPHAIGRGREAPGSGDTMGRRRIAQGLLASDLIAPIECPRAPAWLKRWGARGLPGGLCEGHAGDLRYQR